MLDNKLIESTLQLTGKNMYDVSFDEMQSDGMFKTELSIEKFCYYLLSRTFTEEYYYKADMSSDGKARYEVAGIFGTAIQDFQEGNEEPLQELLSKIGT